MSHRLILLASVLAGALVVGCTDQTPSEPSILQPSFRTEQNPEGPGAFVLLFPEFGAFISDPAEAGFAPPNLTIHLGSTFDQLLDFCATGEPELTDIDRLIVIRPHSTEESPDWHTIVHGSQLPMIVWEQAIPFIDPLGEVCNLVLNVPHLQGTGQLTSTDNDLFTTGERSNAAHTTINGQVTSEDGQRYRVTGREHILILRSGEFRHTFDLNLIPIGQ